MLAEGEAAAFDYRGNVINGNPAKLHNLYPAGASIASDLPPSAKRYLEQAVDILHAPDAAAVMAASAVDAMLKAKGFTEGALYKRIKAAVEAHVLTEDMGKWAHAVRLEANSVRHVDADRPHLTREEAVQVVEFARALGDFLFVLTARVSAGIAASGGTEGSETS